MKRLSGLALAAVLAAAAVSTIAAPAAIAAPAPAGSGYTPVAPVRVLDTRAGGAVGPNGTVTIDLSNRVPLATTAVLINVTGTQPTASTYITAFPAGTARPNASNINLLPGQTRPNLVTVAVGADRKVGLFNDSGNVHLIADLAGYYAPGAPGKYTPITANRIVDTRSADHHPRPAGPLGPGRTETFDLSDDVPAATTAVTFNLTATGATAPTYVTAWPADSARPGVSNINLWPGETNPNQVTIPVGPGRRINLYNEAGSTHLIADLVGFYTPEFGATFNPRSPQRVLDTRDGTGVDTGPGPIGANDQKYRGFNGTLPDSLAGVVLNVTGTQPTAGTYVSVSALDERSGGSSLNLDPGQTAANLVTAPTGGSLGIEVYNAAGAVHVIADLAGYFAYPPAAPCTTNCLYSWGSNRDGQLGTGAAIYQKREPLQAYGLSNVKAVAGGDRTGFALRTDGTVWGWGNNRSGDLGEWWIGSSVVPVQIKGLSNITAIGNGIALRGDGTVWTWGFQAGYNSSPAPRKIEGLGGITAVAAGASTAYALRNDGVLFAWGTNNYGELGNGAPPSFHAATPVQVMAGVKAVAAASFAASAVKTDGTVWSWGTNHSGELGNGTTSEPTSVPQRSGALTGVTTVAADHSRRFAVLADGTVWAWGSNRDGAIGNGQICDDDCPVTAPSRITGLTGIQSVAVSRDSGGYALDTSGRIWAWGSNNHGQFGTPESGDPAIWRSGTPLRLSAPTGATAISGGLAAGFALAP